MIKEELISKRIRQMRFERKLTQQELAKAVGVTKGYISRIENSDTAPPVGTLIALAQALGIELNDFLKTDDPEVYVTVTKKDQRPSIARDSVLPVTYEHLALNFPNRAFEAFIMKMSSESTQNSQLNQHRGQELLFILKGEVEVNVNGNTYILEKGDSIHFNSSYPHNGSCLSKDGAELIGIIYNEPDDPLFPSGARCP